MTLLFSVLLLLQQDCGNWLTGQMFCFTDRTEINASANIQRSGYEAAIAEQEAIHQSETQMYGYDASVVIQQSLHASQEAQATINADMRIRIAEIEKERAVALAVAYMNQNDTSMRYYADRQQVRQFAGWLTAIVIITTALIIIIKFPTPRSKQLYEITNPDTGTSVIHDGRMHTSRAARTINYNRRRLTSPLIHGARKSH